MENPMKKIFLFCMLLAVTSSAQWNWNDNDSNKTNYGMRQPNYTQTGNTVQQGMSEALEQILANKIHKEIYEIVSRTDMPEPEKAKKIMNFDYRKSKCNKYLGLLASRALNYINNPTYINKLSFLHLYQRPPKDYIKIEFKPTVFYITITQIDINLSDTYYESLRGFNDANPIICISKRLNDKKITWNGHTNWAPTSMLWCRRGPINTKNFSFTQNSELSDLITLVKLTKMPYEEILETHIKDRTEMWWNTEDDCALIIEIKDDDDSMFDAETLTALLIGKDFEKSNEATWKFDNGTIMTLTWTIK